MPNALNRSQKIGLGAAALASACLLAGYAAGRAAAKGEQVETMVIPPFSMNNARAESVCTHNRAFSDFNQAVNPHEFAQTRSISVATPAVFDRGVVCTVSGEKVTLDKQRLVATTRPFKISLLVSVTGDSEIITEEFAKALSQSKAAKAIGSNFGNDGTVVSVPDVSNIAIGE
ncbi:hypothetical protein F2S72_09340 [Pseudomonas syringae pv. actinidiae]|nr:hypothetical protein [Pseudomonas syringae pv. actinidiae]